VEAEVVRSPRRLVLDRDRDVRHQAAYVVRELVERVADELLEVLCAVLVHLLDPREKRAPRRAHHPHGAPPPAERPWPHRAPRRTRRRASAEPSPSPPRTAPAPRAGAGARRRRAAGPRSRPGTPRGERRPR